MFDSNEHFKPKYQHTHTKRGGGGKLNEIDWKTIEKKKELNLIHLY